MSKTYSISFPEMMEILKSWYKRPGNVILWENNTAVDVQVTDSKLTLTDTYGKDPLVLYQVEPEGYNGGFDIADNSIVGHYILFNETQQLFEICSDDNRCVCVLTMYKQWASV